jgi:uncharacterized protein (DUF983 family)
MCIQKGNKLYSIVHFKCPQCHEGDFFLHKKTWNLSKITQLHSNCPNCDLKYMLEPSFFYGAMYVAYALTVGISITVFLISHFILGLDLWESFLGIIVVLILSGPINLKIARIIWINLFISFDKSIRSK